MKFADKLEIPADISLQEDLSVDASYDIPYSRETLPLIKKCLVL
jgi:hypothetical protein